VFPRRGFSCLQVRIRTNSSNMGETSGTRNRLKIYYLVLIVVLIVNPMGRILVRWKFFRNNLDMLCNPICNGCTIITQKRGVYVTFVRWRFSRFEPEISEFLFQGVQVHPKQTPLTQSRVDLNSSKMKSTLIATALEL